MIMPDRLTTIDEEAIEESADKHNECGMVTRVTVYKMREYAMELEQ